MIKKTTITYFLLVIIVVLFFLLRIYKLNNPIADHHSWRQADTAAVARNFIKEGYSFFKPRIDNMTYLHSPSITNDQRLFMAEPPIYQTFIAGFYKIFGVKEIYARLTSILISLGTLIFLYLLVRDFLGIRVALLSIFFFSVLPYSVYYSRVVLPEPLMVFLSVGSLFFISRWIENNRNLFWILSVIFLSLAFTQKVFPFFLLLPIVYLLLRKYKWNTIRQPKVLFLLLFPFIPFILWRLWINNYPSGIPPYDWLFNQGNIRFKGAFFWWIFAQRLGGIILGYWGLIPLGLGLMITPRKKEGWFFHLWILSILIYTTVLAAGNVTHDYYQIPFVPILAIFLAKGVDCVINNDNYNKAVAYLVTVVSVIFMISFSWYQVRDFYNIQGGVDLAGQAVDQLTPKDALVITGDTNDSTLLYNTNRHGWTGGYASYYPNMQSSIETLKSKGATTYVTTKWGELKDTDFGKYMENNYKLIKTSNQFIVFDLISK